MADDLTWDLRAGDLLFREGDPWDGLYLVKAGSIEIFRERNGQTIRLGVLGPGEFLGTVTLFSREPRTACARAATDITIQHFTPEIIHHSFTQAPPGVTAIFKDILARLKHVNQQLVDSRLEAGDRPPDWMICLRHMRQFVNFLMVVCRLGCVANEEGKQLFKLAGFSLTAESVLGLRADYIDRLLGLLVKSNVLQSTEVADQGFFLVNPAISKLQAFLEYSERPDRLEVIQLDSVHREVMPALRLLSELMAAPGFGDIIPAAKLTPLLQRIWADVPPEEAYNQLAELGFIDPLGENQRVRLNCPKLLQYTFFNQVLIGLHALTPHQKE